MSIISYAQNFEDVMLWRALGHVERGFYIDIGAQDPTIDSVSLAFHEHGWQGIHVEPTPHYAELLRQQRPGDTIIQAAVGNSPGLLQFFEIPNTGISTANAEIAQKHRERGFDVQEITVTSITLSAIFDTCPEEIHWLKIDVEGFEKQLLLSWENSRARPWIVIVESTLPLTEIETHESWEYLIIKYGYSPVYFDGLNRYYVSHAHPKLKAAFSVPPNVFDGFALNGTASAPFHRIIEDRFQKKINEDLTHNEQQKVLLEEETKRLRALHSSLRETYAKDQQNWLCAEKTLSEKSNQIKQELEALRHDQAQRDREMAEHTRSQSDQESALYEQLSRLQHERVAREQTLHEQTNLVRQEIETILRTQTQRELEVGEQLRQAEKDKVELIRKHSEEERALHYQHAERERTNSEQAGQTRHEVERLLYERVHREQQIAAQLIDLHQHVAQEKAELIESHGERERAVSRQYATREEALKQQRQTLQEQVHSLQKERAKREQDVGEQLLAIQHQVFLETAEQLRKHAEETSELYRLHIEREQFLHRQLEAGKDELHILKQNLDRCEKEHSEQTSQSRQTLETLLWEHRKREQEMNAQLLAIRLQAQQEKAEHERLLQTCEAMATELQAETEAGKQVDTHLRHLLEEVQNNLDLTRASLSWRITAPLRKIIGLFNSHPDQTATIIDFCDQKIPEGNPPFSDKEALTCGRDPKSNEQGMANVGQRLPIFAGPTSNNSVSLEKSDSVNTEALPIGAHSKPLVPNVSKFTSATVTTMPPIALTLPELLAYQDKQFVYCAYQTLLGRNPDPEGLGYYVGRLRMGFPKIEVLAQLRNSKEADLHKAILPQLDQSIEHYQKGQYPLIGWIFRIFNGTEGKGQTEIKLRSITNQIYLLGADSSSRIDRMEASLLEIHKLLTSRENSQPQEQEQEQEIKISITDPERLKNHSPRAKSIYAQFKLARTSMSLGSV